MISILNLDPRSVHRESIRHFFSPVIYMRTTFIYRVSIFIESVRKPVAIVCFSISRHGEHMKSHDFVQTEPSKGPPSHDGTSVLSFFSIKKSRTTKPRVWVLSYDLIRWRSNFNAVHYFILDFRGR